MAERMTFEDLVSFLYMDLYRGMAAGNVPRQCHNCGRWFLAIGAYDNGVLSAGAARRDGPHLPSGGRSQKRAREERQGLCLP